MMAIPPLDYPSDVASVRSLFPITDAWTYLQNASIGPCPTPVLEAVAATLRSQAEAGTEEYPSWLTETEDIRVEVARLINAPSDAVSFIRNTAEGLARVARGLNWRAGDNVVSYAHEYPTNVLPWLALKERGVELRLASGTNGRLTVEDLAPWVDGRTRLVALSSVQFANGFRLDVDRIGEFCRERGVLFSVDAIQHLGALPFDVSRSPVDFVSAGAHKWLLAPAGAGLFYVRPDVLDQLHVIEVGYAGTEDYSIDDELLNYRLNYKRSARRFEGGLPAFSALAGLGAAAALFTRLGTRKITDHVLSVTDRAVEGLHELGMPVLSPRDYRGEKSGIVSFVHPSASAQEVKRYLRGNGISVSMRVVQDRAVIRISPHVYNTAEEIDAFLDCLAALNGSSA